MATATLPSIPTPTDLETLGDLLEALGGIDPARVRLRPAPGTATEADLEWLNERKQGHYELVDGVMVAKPMGALEAMLAVSILRLLDDHIKPLNPGLLFGPDGMMRLSPTITRLPDVALVPWDRIPPGPLSKETLSALVPDLAVEVLSPSNTRAEMTRKRAEYFAAGVRLVWEVDPATRTVAIYLGPDEAAVLDSAATLDGGAVLPGFRVAVADLFADLDRRRP